MKTRKLGILLFDDVEVLDFAGPFEVFSIACLNQDPKPFEVMTLAESTPIQARNGLSVNPTHLIHDAPPLDILLVPGGPGARREIHNDRLLDWIREQASQVELLLSVCTGALLLAKSGLTQGMKLTTHHLAIPELEALVSKESIDGKERFIDNGKVILSAGVSAGLDMSFYLVAKLFGDTLARKTADFMEYDWPN